MTGEYKLRDEDLALILTLMGPNHVMARAEDLGEGCAVYGAPFAYMEVRNQIRGYLRFVRGRDSVHTRDLNLALNLRAIGWVPFNYKQVGPLTYNDWRETASIFWGQEGNIPGKVTIDVGHHSQKRVDVASTRAIGKMLETFPKINRAYLQGRCWQRFSPEVMIHRTLRDKVRSVIFDPTNKSHKDIERLMRKNLRRLIEIERNPTALVKLAPQLMQAWAREGFITSHAGAMVSLAGSSGVEEGWAALVPANGIPLAITVCKVIDGKVVITFSVDHKCIDGDVAGKGYQFLKEEIPKLLEEE